MRLSFGIFAAAIAISGAAQAAELEHLWTLTGFSNPESVALGPDRTTLYVSNVAGEAAAVDGEGFISRVSLDGEMIELRWAEGLNAPKGLVIDGDRLFVSDIDAVVEVSLANGAILARTTIPEARFLNDTAFTPDGSILVSDSAGARIYQITEGEVTIFAEGDWLAGANGLLFEGSRLLLSTMDTHGLYTLAPGVEEPELIAGELGAADGIAVLPDGAYLVSEWPGRLFHVTQDGEVSTLLDTRADNVYLNDFLLLGDRLLIPNWEPGTLTAYRVHF
jgi:sugar lactone lactonase YvrE